MLKKTSLVIAGLAAFTVAGCGPTAEDLVGTWAYDTGTEFLSTCNDEEQDPIDLSGGTFELKLGETYDLLMVTGYDEGCYGALSFEGGELHSAGTEGDCTDDGTTEGVESTGEIYWIYDASGDAAKLVAAGEVTTTYTDYDLTCTSRINGAASKQ